MEKATATDRVRDCNSSPASYDLDKINALLGVSGYSAASYRVGDVIYSLNQPDSKFNMCSEGGRLFIFPSSVVYVTGLLVNILPMLSHFTPT